MTQRNLIFTASSVAFVVAAGASALVFNQKSRESASFGDSRPKAGEALRTTSSAAVAEAEVGVGPKTRAAFNRVHFEVAAPWIPPQCYTKASEKTADGKEVGQNPCYVCHNEPQAPNFIDDLELQSEYSFPRAARNNPWTNLFLDRSAAIEKVSDAEILSYVRSSNYFDESGQVRLQKTLQTLPEAWDANGNGKWDGFVPDVAFSFDEDGFDVGADGKATGWRAYAYYPFQGTFWPTNGSAGDVLMRLPSYFSEDESGAYSRAAYILNFAIIESLMKMKDVVIEPTDEKQWGVDLDNDGTLGTARVVRFAWAPREGKRMSYVGRAKQVYQDRAVEIAAGLLPVDTEILHTVRYLDVADGKVQMAARLKELRYAKKTVYRTYSQLEEIAFVEAKEKGEDPDRLRELRGDAERGIYNGQGWRYMSFIEDQAGDLRPQTVEETAFCMGCHGGVSQTRDGVFSFMRKLDASTESHGWYHWSQSGVAGLAEPKRADGKWAYSTYLMENHAGDEFRGNQEVISKFFTENGEPKKEAFEQLHTDIAFLLLPSQQRALALNKAYREVVREQSFTRGRDAVLSPVKNVHRSVKDGQETGVRRVVSSDLSPTATEARL